MLTPIVDGMCKRFVSSEDMKEISIIDTKGIDVIGDDARKIMRRQIERSSAVFVVFDAGNIRSPKLWDVLEGCPEKRMIFILTKCDLISEVDLAQNIGKMKSYMQESGISAPLFAVNCSEDKEIKTRVHGYIFYGEFKLLKINKIYMYSGLTAGYKNSVVLLT